VIPPPVPLPLEEEGSFRVNSPVLAQEFESTPNIYRDALEFISLIQISHQLLRLPVQGEDRSFDILTSLHLYILHFTFSTR